MARRAPGVAGTENPGFVLELLASLRKTLGIFKCDCPACGNRFSFLPPPICNCPPLGYEIPLQRHYRPPVSQEAHGLQSERRTACLPGSGAPMGGRKPAPRPKTVPWPGGTPRIGARTVQHLAGHQARHPDPRRHRRHRAARHAPVRQARQDLRRLLRLPGPLPRDHSPPRRPAVHRRRMNSVNH